MSNDNSNSNFPASQMSFFDDDLIPLHAAEKFGFDLPYIVGNDGKTYFRLLSWLTGCVGDNAGKLIRNIRSKGTFGDVTFEKSHLSVPEKDIMGRTQIFEYVTDTLIYRITEDLRATKDRPVVGAIKDYLAKAGATLDALRKQQPQIEKPRNTRERRYLAKQQVYGHLDKSEAMNALQVRRDTTSTFNEMRHAISLYVENPNYPQIINTEYVSVFGKTASDLKRILNTQSIRDELSTEALKGLQFLESAMTRLITNSQGMSNQQALSAMIKMAGSIRDVLDMLIPQMNNLIE